MLSSKTTPGSNASLRAICSYGTQPGTLPEGVGLGGVNWVWLRFPPRIHGG